jgi:hypothetical protein
VLNIALVREAIDTVLQPLVANRTPIVFIRIRSKRIAGLGTAGCGLPETLRDDGPSRGARSRP